MWVGVVGGFAYGFLVWVVGTVVVVRVVVVRRDEGRCEMGVVLVVSVTGVMFDPVGDGQRFPTVLEVGDSVYANRYAMDFGTFGGWSAVARDPRGTMHGDADWEAMDETNFAAVCAELGFGFVPMADDVVGACEVGAAICDRVLILDPAHDDFADRIDEAMRLHKALCDYPLLDEEAHSALEFEAWQQYAPTAWADEVRDLRTGRSDTHERDEDRADILACIDAGDALNVLANHLHYNYGFSGEYWPSFLVIADELETIADDAAPCPAYAWKFADATRWVALVDQAAAVWADA